MGTERGRVWAAGAHLLQTGWGFSPTQGAWSQPIPLGCPAPPWSPQGSFSQACPVTGGQRQALPLPWPCPKAATVNLPRSLFPGPGPGAFTCYNNNILRIECRWPGPALGQGAGSWLLFTR